jgi:hypothetical protein
MSADHKQIEQTRNLVERLNKTTVTKKEILEIVEKSEHHDDERKNFFGHIQTLVALHQGDQEKVSAIMFRMEALAKLIQGEGIPGWTESEAPDGSVLTQESVFAAAAVHPLIEKDGDVEFDRESFLLRVLELAEVDTVG